MVEISLEAAKLKQKRFEELKAKKANSSFSNFAEVIEYALILKDGIQYIGTESYERPADGRDFNGSNPPHDGLVQDTREVEETLVGPDIKSYQNLINELINWSQQDKKKEQFDLFFETLFDFSDEDAKPFKNDLVSQDKNIKALNTKIEELKNLRVKMLEGTKKEINDLRKGFINKAENSPHFAHVPKEAKVTFYVPGLDEQFSRGNVTFSPALQNQHHISYSAENDFNLDGHPYTRSLKRRMEKENYLYEAREKLIDDKKPVKEVLQDFNHSLNQEIAQPRKNKEGHEMKTRKDVLAEHRHASPFMIWLYKTLEKLFGNKPKNTVDVSAVSVAANRHTNFFNKTRSEKRVLDPLEENLSKFKMPGKTS